ncbi:hypothetical protein [Nocardia xishanensis]|uniref:hypothetical protein n=1 Tax=Nocardia xishanensis TaxID=238964 RepID=UPI000AD95E83|nr:hypothetical protein [Nocardia xishanensis]
MDPAEAPVAAPTEETDSAQPESALAETNGKSGSRGTVQPPSAKPGGLGFKPGAKAPGRKN